jgi:pimeloyl-ACP methyl ester carboxylesterase
MMERARIDDVELEYEVTGTGEPVLLIGHVIADALAPLTTQPALEGYQFVRYRKRGFGGSTHTPPPVTIAQHAADAAALLEHLGLSPAHVVGGSAGGCVALQLAVDHPETVSTLVLLEPSFLTLPSAQAVLAKAGPALEAYADGRAADAVSMFFSAVTGVDRASCEAMLEKNLPNVMAAAVDDADTLFGAELPAALAWSFGTAEAAAVDVPVLSVVGADTDQLWFDSAALLRLCLRDVEDCTVDGVGHFLQLQDPEPVARAIADFLARHPVTATAAVSAVT